MLPKAKKYLITTEKHEIFIVRNGHQAIRGFCPECANEAEMLNLDAAISVSGITALEILRRIEKSEIHFLETANGHLLLCRESLGQFINTVGEQL